MKEQNIKCNRCNGDGEIEDNGPKTCPSCGGNGYIIIEMEEKHTPGPWKISNTGSPITHHWKIKNFDGLHIAEVNIGMSDFKANAELIARAPELLQQVKQLEAERSELLEKMTELLKAFNDSDKNYADWVATKELYSAFTGVNNLLERLTK